MTPSCSRNVVTVPAPLPAKVHQIYDHLAGWKKIDDRGQLLFELTRSHYELWNATFPLLPINDLDGSIERMQGALIVAPVTHWEPKYAPKLQPWHHQIRALDIGMSRKYFAFWHDMGCGKSAEIVRLVAELFGADRINLAVVITQGRGLPQFMREEVPKHTPWDISFHVDTLPMGKRRETWWRETSKPRMLVLSPGAFSSKKQLAELQRICRGSRTAIFIDECFVAGTLIKMPSRDMNIELIKIGDTILSSDGPRKVKRVFIGKSQRIVKLKLSNGKIIGCTENHPIFTDLGWVRAIDTKGRILYAYKDMCSLWQRVHIQDEWEEISHEKILREILLSEMANKGMRVVSSCYIQQGSECETNSFTYRNEKTEFVGSKDRHSVSSGNLRQDISDTETEGACIQRAWGQWEVDYNTRIDVDDIEWRLENRLPNHIGKTASRLSTLLQSGLGFTELEISYRDRRCEPQHSEGTSQRQKETGCFGRIRVDSVTIEESYCPQNVWNLEIEGCPHYYANGVLVHNSQNFKSWSGTRFDNLLKLKQLFEYRFLFSGEPQPLGPIDLFAQFYFMDKNIIGHEGIMSFHKEFCEIGGYLDKQILEYKNQEKLTERIAPHCEYVKLEDCMDMPKRIWREAQFEPTQQQRDLYEQMKNEFCVLLDQADNETDAVTKRRLCDTAAAKTITLTQIARGWFFTDPLKNEQGVSYARGEVVHITDERTRYTIEEHCMNTRKAILWCAGHPDLDSVARVLEELGVEGVEFSGRLSSLQGEINRQRFIEDKRCRIFYGTVAAGGTSLNLQVASHMTFHSNTNNYGHRAQAERRIWRPGQEHPCLYTDILGFPCDSAMLIRNQRKEDWSQTTRTLVGLRKLVMEL